MNALIAVILGAITVYLTYTRYARRIDRNVIQSDPKRATPATLYMDGVDFMPTNRNILFGYHFKSIAAAGPIVGAIVAATLWGWLPAMIWLIGGVAFMGWVSDYSAIVMSVRNEGHSLSAIAHRLISPRTRTILFLFIFFYLLLVAGAFVGIMATVMETQPRTHMGMILLVVMGLLLGQMLYRWHVGLVPATLVTVGITLVAIMTGHASESIFKGLNDSLNSLTGGAPLVTYFDPTLAGFKGAEAKIMPSLFFWALAISIFCYAGSVLPIWRMAQPVVYVGFWITALAMLLGLGGAALGTFVKPEVAYFSIPAFKGWNPQMGPSGVMPLWPMLFVTIACGAISGWHALFGTVGTARQIENETDIAPGGRRFDACRVFAWIVGAAGDLYWRKGQSGRCFRQRLRRFHQCLGIPAGLCHLTRFRCIYCYRFGRDAVVVSCHAGDVNRVVRRNHPAAPEPTFCVVYLHRLGDSSGDDRNLDLSLAALWRSQPADGGAFTAAGDDLAGLGGQKLGLCRNSDDLHVHHHLGFGFGNGL
jgi:hypothetical protein